MAEGLLRQLVRTTDPSASPAGFVDLYCKNDQYFFINDAGTITPIPLDSESVQDIVGSLIVGGTGLDAVYNDAGNTLTINIDSATYSLITGALQPGDNISELTNDSGFETPAQLNTRDTNNRNRANHTGSQAISTVTNLQTTLDGKQPIDSDLTALAALAGTGLVVRTGTGTATTRSVAAGTGISVTNADGIAGNPTVTNSDRGSVAVTAHEAAGDPHPQYTTTAEAAAAAPVQSVNGETGTLTNYAKTNVDNNFTVSQTIDNGTVATIDFDASSGTGDALSIYRTSNGSTPLWSVGNNRSSGEFRISRDNGLSTNVELRMTSSTLDVTGKLIQNVTNPVNAQDAATKAYVDSVAGTPIFGQGFEDFIDTTPFATNSGSIVTAASFTTASKAAGRYRVGMQWNFTTNSTTSSSFFSLWVDGVDVLPVPLQVELKDSTDDITYNIFHYITFGSAGTHTLQLRVQTENGMTCTINTVKTEIWRVS